MTQQGIREFFEGLTESAMLIGGVVAVCLLMFWAYSTGMEAAPTWVVVMCWTGAVLCIAFQVQSATATQETLVGLETYGCADWMLFEASVSWMMSYILCALAIGLQALLIYILLF